MTNNKHVALVTWSPTSAPQDQLTDAFVQELIQAAGETRWVPTSDAQISALSPRANNLATGNQTGLDPELLDGGFKAQPSDWLERINNLSVSVRLRRSLLRAPSPPNTELQKPAQVALLPPGIIKKKEEEIKKYSYLMMAVSPWRMVMLSVVRCMSTLRTGNPVGRRQSSLKKEACSCLQHDLRPSSIFKANESTSR